LLSISVGWREEPPWRRTYAFHHILLGGAPHCSVVLDGSGIAEEHARILHDDGAVIVVAIDRALVAVDGANVHAKQLVRPDSRITIGDYTIHAERMTARTVEGAAPIRIRSPEERLLLDAIARGDRHSRIVYADWLEGRGDILRAEYLRIQSYLYDAADDDPTIVARGDRMRELAAAIDDLAWRTRVAMQEVDSCAFELSCPRAWDRMTATDRDGVRHCSTCERDVRYCTTAEEARGWAARGACVALDITAPRWNGDLDAPFNRRMCERCSIDVGHGLDECPRCGASVSRPRTMLLGRLALPRR
jgi:uncharacterized protein (TIGR02996 family)